MKKYIFPCLFFLVTVLVVLKFQPITNYVADVLEQNPVIQIPAVNQYAKKYDFVFVKLTDDYRPFSYKDIINIYFNVINSGWDTFTFYCPAEYIDCYDDVKSISENQFLLTSINNFVHPFNNFKNIKTSISESGEMLITVIKLYTPARINEINELLDELTEDLLSDPEMDNEEKLRAIHDYIVHNSIYDTVRAKEGSTQFESNTAYGVLFQGYGICSGYSDAMALFLERLNIKNFKVASTTHVWNAAFVNDEWIHIDLTWDNPVSSDGKKYPTHKYFMIKTEKFADLDKPTESDHVFDLRIYSELK